MFSNTNYGLEGVEDSPVGEFRHALSTDILTGADEGVFLGLDVSKTGTGISLWNGEQVLWGIVTLEDQSGPHSEALYRRLLRAKLNEEIGGMEFKGIAVEDVFSGGNPKTARLLIALNTVIDDMILDGDVTVAEGGFRRIDNKEWKSMLRHLLDPHKTLSSYNDKALIQNLLSRLGIEKESGKGGQDKLDAFGIMLGGMIDLGVIKVETITTHKVRYDKLKLSNLAFAYDYSEERMLAQLPQGIAHEEFTGRVTEKNILATVESNRGVAWITKDLVNIGNLYIKANLEPFAFGGYFGFYVKD